MFIFVVIVPLYHKLCFISICLHVSTHVDLALAYITSAYITSLGRPPVRLHCAKVDREPGQILFCALVMSDH